ncbi:MAG: hypothetical protein N3B13_12020, partial [Deltaproteobacteria bacterium]|nr:hypothetical protein [Deltaproteobacteria bacterium]
MKRKWTVTSILVSVAIITYIGFFLLRSDKEVKQNDNASKEVARNPSNTNIVVTVEPPDTVYKIYPQKERLAGGREDAIVKILLFADFSDSKSLDALRILKEMVLTNKEVSLYIYAFPVYKN